MEKVVFKENTNKQYLQYFNIKTVIITYDTDVDISLLTVYCGT
jgi:hypothetical protein